jgi:hypothetical protein
MRGKPCLCGPCADPDFGSCVESGVEIFGFDGPYSDGFGYYPWSVPRTLVTDSSGPIKAVASRRPEHAVALGSYDCEGNYVATVEEGCRYSVHFDVQDKSVTNGVKIFNAAFAQFYANTITEGFFEKHQVPSFFTALYTWKGVGTLDSVGFSDAGDYLYVAFASGPNGEDFTLTYSPDLPYISVRRSPVAIPTPAQADFETDGVLPEPLLPATAYTVCNATANTFQLQRDGIVVDITTDGDGMFRYIPASSVLWGIVNADAATDTFDHGRPHNMVDGTLVTMEAVAAGWVDYRGPEAEEIESYQVFTAKTNAVVFHCEPSMIAVDCSPGAGPRYAPTVGAILTYPSFASKGATVDWHVALDACGCLHLIEQPSGTLEYLPGEWRKELSIPLIAHDNPQFWGCENIAYPGGLMSGYESGLVVQDNLLPDGFEARFTYFGSSEAQIISCTCEHDPVVRPDVVVYRQCTAIFTSTKTNGFKAFDDDPDYGGPDTNPSRWLKREVGGTIASFGRDGAGDPIPCPYPPGHPSWAPDTYAVAITYEYTPRALQAKVARWSGLSGLAPFGTITETTFSSTLPNDPATGTLSIPNPVEDDFAVVEEIMANAEFEEPYFVSEKAPHVFGSLAFYGIEKVTDRVGIADVNAGPSGLLEYLYKLVDLDAGPRWQANSGIIPPVGSRYPDPDIGDYAVLDEDGAAKKVGATQSNDPYVFGSIFDADDNLLGRALFKHPTGGEPVSTLSESGGAGDPWVQGHSYEETNAEDGFVRVFSMGELPLGLSLSEEQIALISNCASCRLRFTGLDGREVFVLKKTHVSIDFDDTGKPYQRSDVGYGYVEYDPDGTQRDAVDGGTDMTIDPPDTEGYRGLRTRANTNFVCYPG